MTILAAASAEVAAIDTVFPEFPRHGRLSQAECLEAERDGFTGKMAIHPAQVPVINAAFTPSAEAVEHSAARSSRPSRPREIRASSASTARCTTARTCGWPRRLLARAKAAGIDVPA